MNGNGHAHPGRSVEFLSRLHDGDLPAGERARFESHRARCAECRRAAIEFEDALRLFRSARSVPPRSDLAARILRKVQTTNRPRAPFPMRFRIDLGWAALLLTALLALLIASPITVRQPVRLPAPQPPPASPPPQAVEKVPERPPATSAREKEVSSDSAPLPDLRVRENAPAAGNVLSRRDAGQSKEVDRSIGEARREAPRIASAAPQPGGAGEEGEPAARFAAPAATLRVTFHEIDGFGSPPALRSAVRLELPTSERGREYVLVVDAQGTVSVVTPENEVGRMISRLRFEAGPRPRRLLVRIQ